MGVVGCVSSTRSYKVNSCYNKYKGRHLVRYRMSGFQQHILWPHEYRLIFLLSLTTLSPLSKEEQKKFFLWRNNFDIPACPGEGIFPFLPTINRQSKSHEAQRKKEWMKTKKGKVLLYSSSSCCCRRRCRYLQHARKEEKREKVAKKFLPSLNSSSFLTIVSPRLRSAKWSQAKPSKADVALFCCLNFCYWRIRSGRACLWGYPKIERLTDRRTQLHGWTEGEML